MHEPDGAQPALAKGATEMFLVGFAGGTGDWDVNGRMLVLHEDPSDGSEPQRHLVHVTEYEEMPDALAGLNVTRVPWSEDEALKCPGLQENLWVDPTGDLGRCQVAQPPSRAGSLRSTLRVPGPRPHDLAQSLDRASRGLDPMSEDHLRPLADLNRWYDHCLS